MGLENTLDIAVRDLRSNYGPEGIYAGKNQFREYWVRDACFAIFGANILGDFDIVRKTLETFLDHQAPDGHIPLRIEERNHFLNYLGITKTYDKPRPVYRGSHPISGKVIDSNTLLVIAFSDYVQASGDLPFLKQNYDRLIKSLEWSIGKTREYLLFEDLLANRHDTIFKKGHVLYSNVIYYKALCEMAYLSGILGDYGREERYRHLLTNLRQGLQKKFWNGNYFIDWIDRKVNSFFNIDGNLLSILWGVAGKRQSRRIEDYITKTGLDQPLMIGSHPLIPLRNKSLASILVGLHDYSDGAYWLHTACLDAQAKIITGRDDYALGAISTISSIIERDGSVCEVYDHKTNPMKRLLYKSDRGFSWSAGILIDTIKKFGVTRNPSPAYSTIVP
jgi:hypothetical protein